MTELVWDGKYDKEGRKVTPVRIELPFQTVETVNESAQERQRALEFFTEGRQGEWRNRLIWGDKKYVLPSLLNEFAGQVNLIYIDPPFDTGANFSFTTKIPESDESFTKEPSIIEQKAYRDTWGRGLDSYVQWLYDTVLLLAELLADDGSFYLHMDENVGHYAKCVLDEVFSQECFQREIIWRIGWISGYKSAAPNWIRNHDVIYYYTRDSRRFTFNKEYIPYPDGYVRRDGKAPTGAGYPMEDVWNASEIDKLDSIQIMSFSGEKVGYPTQKNENLLQRIINASSNEGDLVLDCFVGSGTTAAVAEKLNRRWIACDLSRFAIHTTRKRLLNIPNVRPFAVQNLGKYERQAWQKAEFENPEDAQIREAAYRRFILALYHADALTGYAWLHGLKAGRFVHVGTVDAPVTLDDVRKIAAEVWQTAGSGQVESTEAAVDILGWEFAFELNEMAIQMAAEARVDLKFKHIPREVMDKKAVEQGDVHFYELAALEVSVKQNKRTVTLELTDFIMSPENVPEEVQRSIRHWEQWIDYWAVDWDYRGDAFHNQWQSYRTRKDPGIQRRIAHKYEESGQYVILMKVIDLFGNDTTKSLTVEVK